MSTVDKLAEKMAEHTALLGESVRDAIRAGLGETTNALRVTGARYRPWPSSSSLLNGGPGRLVGWSVLATGGPVTVTLHDGRDTGADVFAILDLVAGESDRTWFGGPGVSFGEALYAEVTGTGRLVGAVYLGAKD